MINLTLFPPTSTSHWPPKIVFVTLTSIKRNIIIAAHCVIAYRISATALIIPSPILKIPPDSLINNLVKIMRRTQVIKCYFLLKIHSSVWVKWKLSQYLLSDVESIASTDQTSLAGLEICKWMKHETAMFSFVFDKFSTNESFGRGKNHTSTESFITDEHLTQMNEQ